MEIVFTILLALIAAYAFFFLQSRYANDPLKYISGILLVVGVLWWPASILNNSFNSFSMVFTLSIIAFVIVFPLMLSARKSP